MPSEKPVKRRRIAPVAVDDDDVPEAQLPQPVFVEPPRQNGEKPTEPPAPGRRIWLDLTQSYDFNYKKVLAENGVKDPGHTNPRAGAEQAAPTPASAPPDRLLSLVQPRKGEKFDHVQAAVERIQRRIQREQNNAATGYEDSDEEEPVRYVGDVNDAAEQDEAGKDDKDDGEDEPEEDNKDNKDRDINNYDMFDDFIDDSEFIHAVENRDGRGTKFRGFYVHIGSVERLGEKEEPKVRKKRDTTKKKDATADAARQAAPSTEAGRHQSPHGTQGNASAPHTDAHATPPGSSFRKAASGKAASQPAQSGQRAASQALADAADRAGGGAGAGGTGGASAGGGGGDAHGRAAAGKERGGSGSAGQASPAVTATEEVELSQASQAATKAAASSQPTGAASAAAAADIEQHAASMRAIEIQLAPDQASALSGWQIPEKLQQLMEALRSEAAATAPYPPNSKKKMPGSICARLDALTRPFYIASESAPNANRAKKALWGILVPMLTPWAAENTIKTKMQQSNSRVMGVYGNEKESFTGLANWVGEHGQESLNHDRVTEGVGKFIDALAHYEGVSLEDADADKRVWEQACQQWETAGGCVVSPEIMKQLYSRRSVPADAGVTTID